jgi:hypothetical protein
MCPFNDKAKLFIQANTRLVIGVHRKFQPQDVEPIVSKAYRLTQKRTAYSSALPSVAYCHADCRDMRTAGSSDRVKAEVTHYLTLYQCH